MKGAVAGRESGLFIYSREDVSLKGFPGKLVPVITTSAPAPTLQLNSARKLHPAREDSKRGREGILSSFSPSPWQRSLLPPPYCRLLCLKLKTERVGRGIGGALGASASATTKTRRLLMPKKCLLNPRQPCNCAAERVKIRNCLLLGFFHPASLLPQMLF